MVPIWYTLAPELPFQVFVTLVKPFFPEKRIISRTFQDIFLSTIEMAQLNIGTREYANMENVRLIRKQRENRIGLFHQYVLGSLPGYEILPTGMDVRKRDRTEIIEVKNKSNTMNSGSAEAVLRKLLESPEPIKILVQINCNNNRMNRYGYPSSIQVMSGRDAYTHCSGRHSFYDDLQKVLEYTFKHYKSYNELTQEIH